MATVYTDVENILGYIRSATPYIWVQTSEYNYAIKDIIHGLKAWLNVIPEEARPKLSAHRWDTAGGMSAINTDTMALTHSDTTGADVMETYPLTEIANIAKRRNQNALDIVFLLDYHEFIDKVNVWRQMQNNYSLMEESGITAVIISPKIAIPSEIQDYVIAIDYPYPGTNFIKNAVLSEAEAHKVTDENGNLKPAPIHDIDKIVNAALGLSRTELYQGINFSLADSDDSGIHAKYITAIKEARLAKDNCIQILPSTEGFESLIGLEELKSFTKDMVLSGKGRGILLLGVPGSGKTHFAATLGKETGRTAVELDFGKLMGGIVGETEQNTTHAFKVIDSMQPCVVIMDEFEKGLAGVSGHNGDSGTSRRQGGIALKWLDRHTSDVYPIATCNSVDDLPPEYRRAGDRWDAIFFLDVPGPEQARGILRYHAAKYGITEPIDDINLDNYTGGEIKNLCRLASSRGRSLAATKKFVLPITQTFDVGALRETASRCAISAEAPADAPTVLPESTGRRSAIIPKNQPQGG